MQTKQIKKLHRRSIGGSKEETITISAMNEFISTEEEAGLHGLVHLVFKKLHLGLLPSENKIIAH